MPSIPQRTQDYSAWYQAIIKHATLAENGPARGSMIIRPYGYALWEKMQTTLDQAIKATGHQNLYFPLLIPQSYLTREANHIEGFAKECAVITHYRLKHDPQRNTLEVDPEAQLEEPLVVRPTSETIVWSTYQRWIQSYRDLPLLYNQWANVVRWEMRTRPFLRTTEILWQEGHTAHATQEEATEETHKMLNVYHDIFHHHLAIPAIKGEKTIHERFAGAQATYTLEARMQDGKALQLATSHHLGQHFSKAFDVTYADPDGNLQHPWGSSWGTTTRLIGALIMTHSDDKGLVLPPKIAPQQTIIIPIYQSQEERQNICIAAQQIAQQLHSAGITSHVDDDDTRRPGWKFSQQELQGIPLRLTLGPRDLTNDSVEVTRRDTGEKQHVPIANIATTVQTLLTQVQHDLYHVACQRQEANTYHAEDYPTFQEAISKGGFVMAHWDGTTETEKAIQAATQATIRCLPSDTPFEEGKCILTGRFSPRKVLFAQAY